MLVITTASVPEFLKTNRDIIETLELAQFWAATGDLEQATALQREALDRLHAALGGSPPYTNEVVL